MKTINILKSTRGEGHIDTGIKIIIAVVIGALILGGLYALFATVILPNLSDEVDAMMEHGENGAVVQRVLDEQSGTYVLKYSYDGKHWNPAQMPNYGDGSSVYNMISGGAEGNTQQAALVKKDNTYYLIASSDGVNWSEQFSFTGNSITHFYTLSRPSENQAYNITQENLVVAALRFDPDIVVVGEIRDAEANSAVEASLTGHTVVTTVHSGPAEAAHGRISLLCQRRFQLGMEVSLAQSRQAFPVVAFAHKCEDNSRKVMDVSECFVSPEGKTEYRCLYRYNITENLCENGKYTINGHFEKVNAPSEHLRTQLTRSGVPLEILKRFTEKEVDA